MFQKLRRAGAVAYYGVLSLGGRYSCSVCGKAVFKFMPFGNGYVDQWRRYGFDHSLQDFETLNAQSYSCPLCGGSDRDRLCAMYIQEQRTPNGLWKPRKLIDFGPSPALSRMLKGMPEFDYRSADLYMRGVDDRIDITDMRAYADNSVDCFICSHVLEHVSSDTKALSELFRVLKPAGWGLVLVPISLRLGQSRENVNTTEAERWQKFGQGDHVRFYSKNDFVLKLSKAGFEVQALGLSHFGSELFHRNGIDRKSCLYVVHKPRH